jgi:hypothetical protein
VDKFKKFISSFVAWFQEQDPTEEENKPPVPRGFSSISVIYKSELKSCVDEIMTSIARLEEEASDFQIPESIKKIILELTHSFNTVIQDAIRIDFGDPCNINFLNTEKNEDKKRGAVRHLADFEFCIKRILRRLTNLASAIQMTYGKGELYDSFIQAIQVMGRGLLQIHRIKENIQKYFEDSIAGMAAGN